MLSNIMADKTYVSIRIRELERKVSGIYSHLNGMDEEIQDAIKRADSALYLAAKRDKESLLNDAAEIEAELERLKASA